jgi:hypothetical protein
MDKYTMDEKFEIIRGKRILDQLDVLEQVLEHSTLADLERNTANFQPATRKRQEASQPVRVVSLEMLPFIGTKNLSVEAVAASEGTNYSPKIIFNQIEFEDESTPTNITFTGKDGNEYNMQPINLGQKTVRVRCDCLDFHWRFASYNAKDKSLIGRAPAPYQRVSNRGPSNPQQVPGICKHLIATIKALREARVVT